MRAKYPQGHPERLKAERAVRQSRKTRRAGEGGSSGGATRTRTAVAGTSRRRTSTSKFKTPEGRTGSTDTTSSVADHQAEYNGLKPFQKRAYDRAKLQGIGHQRSMHVAKAAPVPPKGTAGRAVRKAENKATKAERTPSEKATAKAVGSELKVSPADARLAARLGITVAKVQQMRQLAAALEKRGWSQSEARKLAAGRIVHGRPIPQFAPGKKIARTVNNR